MVAPVRRRVALPHLCRAYKVSVRRACRVLDVWRGGFELVEMRRLELLTPHAKQVLQNSKSTERVQKPIKCGFQ